MKKIISLLAAGILALGLIGCSGNLHDDEYRIIDLSGGAVPGDYESPANWDNTSAWDTVDADTHTYTFNFTTKADCTGDVEFKIVSESGSWNVDGYTEFKVAVDGDATTASMKTGADMGGAGNATITGCKASTSYTMTVVSNPDTTISVKVETAGASAPADPVPYYLVGYFILGPEQIGGDAKWAATLDTMLVDPVLDKKAGTLTYAYQFTAGDTSVEFGIGTKGWATKYTKGTFAVGTDTEYVETTKGDDTNNKITGLTVGKPYKILVQTTPDETVLFKVEEIAAVTLKVKVVGISDGEGQIAILNGEFNSWAGWTSAWGGTKKYDEIPYGTINENGECEIVLFTDKAMTPGDSVSYGACGYYGEPDANKDIADATGEIKIRGDNFSIEFTVEAGTFICTVDLENDTVETALAE